MTIDDYRLFRTLLPDIHLIEKRFDDLLASFGLPPFPFTEPEPLFVLLNRPATLNIRFEDETKPEIFGSRTPEEILDAVRKRYKTTPEIDETILQAENRFCAEGIARQIQDLNGGDYNSIRKELGKLLDTRLRERRILGEYRYESNTIILYKKTIQETPHDCTDEEAFEEVFIHELFHAYHYRPSLPYATCEVPSRRDYTSRVVKESLARWFEREYCRVYGIQAICSDWSCHLLINDPYAGAGLISKTSFRDIFILSCADMDGALRRLTNKEPEQFYDIKNIGTVAPKPMRIVKTTVSHTPSPELLFTKHGFPVYAYDGKTVLYDNYTKTLALLHIIIYKDGSAGSFISHGKKLLDYDTLINNLRTDHRLDQRPDDIAYVLILRA